MKIISYNVNGIRSAISKGFVEWLAIENPDIIQVQEVKAFQEQVDISQITELGYHTYWFSAKKPGYSGVAIFSKIQALNVRYGVGNDFFDAEGRFLQLNFENFTLINSYFPSGTTGEIRQEKKEEYLEIISAYCQKLLKNQPNLIVSGDFNICHKPIDIHNPERNQNTSGFLPQERAWMDSFVQIGFVDSFRACNTQPNKYSWWSYRAGARSKNLGWRIDYNFVSHAIAPKITNASILSDVVHSDHCPVVLEIGI